MSSTEQVSVMMHSLPLPEGRRVALGRTDDGGAYFEFVNRLGETTPLRLSREAVEALRRLIPEVFGEAA